MGQPKSVSGPEGGRKRRDASCWRLRLAASFEPAVLIGGLSLSAAAGIAAWRAVGPYGDGPFGANYRRISAAAGDGTILVHDSRDGRDMVRTVVDEATGRVRELQMVPRGDFSNAVRVLLDENREARVPLDLDGDGVADRWEYYADVRDIASGAIQKVGLSLARDGVVDAWAFHDEQGRVSRVEVSTARDGMVDRWEYYEAGELVRVEADADRDGRVDTWETYRLGILTTTASDADGDGLPDLVPPGER